MQASCSNNPSKERMSPPNGSNSQNCTSVDVKKMSDKEYIEYNRECGTRKSPNPDCDDVDVDNLSDEEYEKFKRNCGRRNPGTGPDYPEKPSRKGCKNIKVEELSSEEVIEKH